MPLQHWQTLRTARRNLNGIENIKTDGHDFLVSAKFLKPKSIVSGFLIFYYFLVCVCVVRCTLFRWVLGIWSHSSRLCSRHAYPLSSVYYILTNCIQTCDLSTIFVFPHLEIAVNPLSINSAFSYVKARLSHLFYEQEIVFGKQVFFLNITF